MIGGRLSYDLRTSALIQLWPTHIDYNNRLLTYTHVVLQPLVWTCDRGARPEMVW